MVAAFGFFDARSRENTLFSNSTMTPLRTNATTIPVINGASRPAAAEATANSPSRLLSQRYNTTVKAATIQYPLIFFLSKLSHPMNLK